MKSGHSRLDSVAIFAILFLLGFGFVIYAVPANALPPVAETSSSPPTNAQGNSVYYRLESTSTSAGANASGYAGIAVNGLTMNLEWSITGGTPGEELTMVMQAVGSTGASKSFTFATVTVSSQGTAGAADTATLDAGTYAVGLKVTDPTTTNTRVIFTSDPSTAQVTLAAQSTVQTSTASSNGLSYTLDPLPVYLHQAVTTDYPFKEGGALIVVSGDTLQVTTSFLGTASAVFTNVVQTASANLTVGTVVTTSTGGGVFKGNITLTPGTYQIGLLLFANGQTASPVAVSVPRAIQVTLAPLGSSSSTTTTHSSTTTTSSSTSSSTATTHTSTTTASSSTSSSSSSTTHSSTSTTHVSSSTSSSTTHTSESSSTTTRTSTSSATSTTSAPPEVTTGHVDFGQVTSEEASSDYLYGTGGGGYSVTGGSIYFSLAFTGESPSSIYQLVLSVNGSARTIGTYVTNANGGGSFVASTFLGTGRFVLSMTVTDDSSFNQPTVVLQSDPTTFTVNAYSGSTTTTETTSPAAIETPKGPQWTFKLSPSTIVNVPSGYKFASSGTVVVSLETQYSILDVEIGFEDANPSTTYNAALILNGTSENLGTMTTSKSGGALLHSSIQVTPGRYLLGIEVFDVSDIPEFNANGPVLVMVSSPNTELAVIVPPNGESSSTSTSASTSGGNSSSTSTTTVTRVATTISAGTQVQDQIRSAVSNLTIPATIQVTPLSSSTDVLDSRFSLSVGQQAGNGLVIAISGQNVTGPRVLLINMSRTSPLALYPALNVTLDGQPVVEATSALQVLNPVATNPPMYVLVATSDSIQLLVSIPHFSLHLIQVAGEIVHTVVSTLALDAPILVGSIIVITLAFAGAYAARKRYFSVLL